MNADQIDDAFALLVCRRGGHKLIGVTSDNVRQVRAQLRKGINVSLEKKIDWLQKAGILVAGEKTFTRPELVSLLIFYKTTSQAARDNGPEYVIEKWEMSNKDK